MSADKALSRAAAPQLDELRRLEGESECEAVVGLLSERNPGALIEPALPPDLTSGL